MQESRAARDALLRFYEAFTAAAPGDMESFDRVFSREPDLMIIGTAFHEWVRGRESGTKAWGMEGVGIEPGDPVGWEHGSVAWAADRPSFVFGEARIPIRILAVMLEEDGDWKIVNAHFSVGVPDEVAGENAVEWSQAAPPVH
jgi:SnoaL-like domain